VHGDWLADDETILNELANSLAGIGIRNLVLFAGVEPDLALAAADDCCYVSLPFSHCVRKIGGGWRSEWALSCDMCSF
jgi:hypothetical protein